MAIAERINPDNLNIHQLQETPEGRPELPFDVYRIITSEIKAKIDDDLNAPLDQDTQIRLAGDYKTLWPDDNIERRINDRELFGMWHQRLHSNKKRGLPNDSTDIDFLRSIIAYAPDVNIKLTWHDIEMVLENNPSLQFDASFWADIVVINPEWIEHITSEQLTQMKLKAEEIQTQGKNEPRTIIDYYNSAAALRLLDPTYKPRITQEEWSSVSHQFKKFNGSMGLHLAKQMKIISAYNVSVTAPGVIKFQMYPPDINISTPPIPEKRQF